MSYAPRGSVDHAGSVEIRFDKPVVDEAMVGKLVVAGSVDHASDRLARVLARPPDPDHRSGCAARTVDRLPGRADR